MKCFKRKKIYLDNNATTKLDKKVLKEMLKDLKGPPYNPSSIHSLGRKAHVLLLNARSKIANILKVKTEEILFSSCATESLNTLIKGSFEKNSHIITTDIEHPCVYNSILDLKNQDLKNQNADITFLKVGSYGGVKKDQIEKAIKKNTKLIVLSYVYSETGILSEIEEIAKIAYKKNINLIVDGVAILGKKKFSISKGISAMVFSLHKIHGPKGIGFAFVKKDLIFKPLLLGGSQEYKKRAGTENLEGILGASKAVELAYHKIDKKIKKMEYLRDLFEKLLKEKIKITINGTGPRICNVSNISFEDISAEDLLIILDKKNIYASHSSACSTKSFKPSRVLLNMGIDIKKVKSSIRFSLSRFTKKKDIIKASKIIIKSVKKLKIKNA